MGVFLSFMYHGFQYMNLSPPWLSLLRYFILFNAAVNVVFINFFFTWFVAGLLLAYRNTVVF